MVKSCEIHISDGAPPIFHVVSIESLRSLTLRHVSCVRVFAHGSVIEHLKHLARGRMIAVYLFYVSLCIYIYMVGGFNPSEKYESQLGWLFPVCGKIKHVPHHQPYIYILYIDYREIHIQYLSVYVKQICFELGHMDVYDMHITVNIQCLFYGVIWLKQNLMATVHSC